MRDFLLLIVAGMALFACRTETPKAAVQPTVTSTVAASAESGPALAPEAGDRLAAGKVVETMNAGRYTYVQVDDGSQRIWAAAPHFAVAVGDDVVVPKGAPMRNFHSQSLDKTFDVVYFVAGIQVVGRPSVTEQVTAAHGAVATRAAAIALDLKGIEKADGGHTVAELYAGKAALVGKEVAVRGKVAKSTSGVMGKNWIHVQDGTGSAGTNDLTVTTSAAAAVGKTVLVRGKLSTDKDFGFGYRYEIIIEDATVTVE